MDRIPITAEGLRRLESDLVLLRTVERPKVIQAIAEARAHGDLSENAEYHAAKEMQGQIEERIKSLKAKISMAQVINPKAFVGSGTIKFGATVTLVDVDTDAEVIYQIVGDDETDVQNGKVGLSSPLARSLIGKSKGDVIEVMVPRGEKSYEVLDVHY